MDNKYIPDIYELTGLGYDWGTEWGRKGGGAGCVGASPVQQGK